MYQDLFQQTSKLQDGQLRQIAQLQCEIDVVKTKLNTIKTYERPSLPDYRYQASTQLTSSPSYVISSPMRVVVPPSSWEHRSQMSSKQELSILARQTMPTFKRFNDTEQGFKSDSMQSSQRQISSKEAFTAKNSRPAILFSPPLNIHQRTESSTIEQVVGDVSYGSLKPQDYFIRDDSNQNTKRQQKRQFQEQKQPEVPTLTLVERVKQLEKENEEFRKDKQYYLEKITQLLKINENLQSKLKEGTPGNNHLSTPNNQRVNTLPKLSPPGSPIETVDRKSFEILLEKNKELSIFAESQQAKALESKNSLNQLTENNTFLKQQLEQVKADHQKQVEKAQEELIKLMAVVQFQDQQMQEMAGENEKLRRFAYDIQKESLEHEKMMQDLIEKSDRNQQF